MQALQAILISQGRVPLAGRRQFVNRVIKAIGAGFYALVFALKISINTKIIVSVLRGVLSDNIVFYQGTLSKTLSDLHLV